MIPRKTATIRATRVLSAWTLSAICWLSQTSWSAWSADTSWMRQAKYGLFMHYQYRILLGYSYGTETLRIRPKLPPIAEMTAEGWNRLVDGFDVKGFADQMAEGQVGWVLFCLDDHYFGWPCAPNKTFDEYTGYAPGERCSRRDLIRDLADALAARGVKLICYYAGLNGCMRDPKSWAGLRDDGNETTPPSAESRQRRIAVLKEFADRYQDKVAGWWFDAVMPDSYREQPHDWWAIKSVVHSANPKSVIAFSWGRNRQACLCKGVDDLTSGDSYTKQDLTLLTPKRMPAQEGILWHGKIYCGNVYHGQGDTNHFSDQELIDWINTCNQQSGVCTLDWPFDPQTGRLKDFGFAQLKRVARAVKGKDSGAAGETLLRAETTPAAAPASAPTAATSILEQAARGIEAHRKGEATIRLARKDGSPVPGAKVEAVQRTHDFAFGNLIRPRHYTNEQYRARFLELFNFVQLLEFNWGQYEREEGQPKLSERRAFIDGWCRSNGLTRFYGHMLTWSYQRDEERDIGPVNPFWLMRYDRDTQFRLLRQRIEREVRDYRDVDILWDVVNEPVHCRRWGDWSKPNDVDEPIAEVLPYVRDALRWAHAANPDARLMINEYRVLPAGKYRDRYRELVEALKKEAAPLHAVGIQAHSPGNGAHWFSPQEIWQTCEIFGTQLGLPIYFTEFWEVSDPKRKMSGARAGGNWSPDLQAEAIEQFYRVAFGHPAVQGIIYFGMIDGETETPTLGLLDANFQPKPAWTRLRKLIKDEWNTRHSASTDTRGTCQFRGFFGQYEVRVMEAGRQHTFRAHLTKDQPNEWNLTVD